MFLVNLFDGSLPQDRFRPEAPTGIGISAKDIRCAVRQINGSVRWSFSPPAALGMTLIST
jgi:hypothetical protein